MNQPIRCLLSLLALQIHTALQNLQLCHKTGVSVPRDRMVRLQREQRLGEQILLDTLGLREVLERSLVLVGSGVEEGVWRGEGEGGRLQESFLSRHRELTTLRETAAQLSKKKVGGEGRGGREGTEGGRGERGRERGEGHFQGQCRAQWY